jgi:hypothetical protein
VWDDCFANISLEVATRNLKDLKKVPSYRSKGRNKLDSNNNYCYRRLCRKEHKI